MNERIKELMLEAGIAMFGDAVYMSNRNDTLDVNVMKKFAELIVQECVSVVEGGRFLHDDAPTAIFARECSAAVKRHFGVE